MQGEGTEGAASGIQAFHEDDLCCSYIHTEGLCKERIVMFTIIHCRLHCLKEGGMTSIVSFIPSGPSNCSVSFPSFSQL